MQTLFRNLFLLSTLYSVCACSSNTSRSEQAEDTAQSAIREMALLEVACYTYTSGKDSVQLYMKTMGDTVSGELIYTLFGKDSNSGTIQGKLKGDTVLADYTFMSEGVESVREIALLKKGNQLVEGFGEVREVNNKMVFTNTGGLSFTGNIRLTKTDCKLDKHGCLPLMGYAWSVTKKGCIRPATTGIRLNDKGEAGSSMASAFLVFSADGEQAELFMPGHTTSLLLERKGTQGSDSWENGNLKLSAWKGYVLKRGNTILYAGQ